MDRAVIAELQGHKAYPSVSILLPLYTESADNRQQTPIRLKNALRTVEDRLLQEFSKRDIEGLQAKLQQLADSVRIDQRAQGLALFANADYGRLFYLPIPVQERVAVNHTFATRDLVIAFLRSPRYRVLSVTEKSAHLYEGQREELHEVTNGFPVTLDVEGVEVVLPTTYHIETTTLHDKHERDFFHRVETALHQHMSQEPLPLALAGVERTVTYFDEIARSKGKAKYTIIARAQGNFETLSAQALGAKIWPLVQEGMQGDRQTSLARLEDAGGTGRFATGLLEVWQMAREGRIDTLLVEDDFHQPARLEGDSLVPVSDAELTHPETIDDAVDETVEAVLNTGGDVVFFSSGELEKHQRMAAILRY